METQPTEDYIIPDEDSIFSLLPDGREVTFPDLGGLRNHVQEEIAAWTNVENTIANKYQSVLGKIEAVAKGAKDGRIAPGAVSEVKKLLQEWAVNTNGINSCVDSHSRLGLYIKELKGRKLQGPVFRDFCLLAMLVLGYPLPQIRFNSQVFPLAIEAAKIAKYFACPKDLTEKIDDYKRRIKELTDAAEEIDRDYKLRKSQFEENLSAAEYKMAALEDAYSKKLQLEGPAQHWKNLSRFYLGWGWGLLTLSLVLGGVAIAALIWLLVQADTIVIFNEDKLSLSTIRASLILIAATSMAGYLLHLFTKLAISCFYLSRDYRERFQLTNVFLAFLRDGDVKCDDQVKQIVMQALFSRSDTGLLKGEHSFKMPGVADLMRKED
jgi:hypothetical protein